MKFAYINKRFRGDGIQLWWNRAVFVEIDKHIIKLGSWGDVRDLMYRLEDIVGEALLYSKRRKYGKDVVVYPDEGKWTLWYKGRSIDMNKRLMRMFPIMLRFFVKKYHKLMLDFNSYKLHEGFEVEIPEYYMTKNSRKD